jgi:WD40 repeat protein
VDNGELAHTLEGHADGITGLAFSFDGTILASGSRDKTIKLWSVAEGKLLRTLAAHTNYVNGIAFSPSGDLLASGSEDGTVRLWGLAGE